MPDMATSVKQVENLLNYDFKNKKLLEEALTHSSYTCSASYDRLEFLGDSALGYEFTAYLFKAYPDLDQGKLTNLRAANVGTENFARIAVRHQLYNYVRRNCTSLDENVLEFERAVQQEEGREVYGGLIAAPKILADIVESIAGALYVDCDFNSKAMWDIFRNLLEPIVTYDFLEQHPHPVTKLFQHFQRVKIRCCRNGDRTLASVYVDGHFVASASSKQKENAELNAARLALQTLSCESSDVKSADTCIQLNGDYEIEGAKHKLHDLCAKKKWPKPKYKIQEEGGPAHEKKYICSVEIEGVLFVKGNEKSRVKEAENSAASAMLLDPQVFKYMWHRKKAALYLKR